MKTRSNYQRISTTLGLALAAAASLTACETHDPEPTPATPPPTCAGKARCITTVIGTGRAAVTEDGTEGWQTPTYTPQDQFVGPDKRVYYLVKWAIFGGLALWIFW